MEFLFADFLGQPAWMWLGFMGLVVVLLALDLGVFHRGSHEIGVRESLALSSFYITVGLAFGGYVWWQISPQAGIEYLTGFVVEKSLAMDNIFVIAMIFGFFAVPRQYQHRVLFWGILGVIVLRAIMIGLGAALVSNYGWVLYIFAAFLILTGFKMLWWSDHAMDLTDNPLLRLVRKRFNVTDKIHGEAFFVRQPNAAGKMATFATPLFLALVTIEGGRRDLRGRLGAGDLRDHHRPVHRLHVEHFCHSGPACALLRAGRHPPPLRLSEAGSGDPAGVHRVQDLYC
jgi:tellurite resistance protein TerC